MKNIGYAKVSHLESVQGYSFDTQEKRLKDYISLHDLGQLDEFSKKFSKKFLKNIMNPTLIH